MMRIRSMVLTLAVTLMLVLPVCAADDTNQTDNGWYWYNKAVDLANAGQFSDALQANEKALAISQNFPLAWANEAGILVQLGRYDDAINASDIVISANISTQFPNTTAAAYYSRGDALRALGRTTEAKTAYDNAYSLDNTLVPPVLGGDIPVSSTKKSPLSVVPVLAALGTVICVFAGVKKR
jgi:tetratricopeptide (TPR) repeat protein